MRIINLILFLLFLFPLVGLTSVYKGEKIRVVFEFLDVPLKDDIQSVGKIPGVDSKSIVRFDSYDSDFFKRLYSANIEKSAIYELRLNKKIKRVEHVFEVESLSIVTPALNALTDDSFSTYQWGLQNNGQTVLSEIDDINSLMIVGDKTRNDDVNVKNIISKLPTMMKKDVIVAVIDSGLDLAHPDLVDNIFKNIKECDANGNLPFKPKEDKDGNGYIGDCMGWNFTTKDNGDFRPYDDKGHGTHVAGIIAASSSNKIGISGIVPGKVKILPLKVIKKKNRFSKSGSSSSFTDWIAKAILYSIKMKVDVINLSLGWPRALDTNYLREAVVEAKKAGIMIIAAAGNNNITRPIFPCSYVGVMCAGAIRIDGEASSFSNYGGMVDLWAPGEGILSTFPEKLAPLLFPTTGYEIKNGTSQAAPHLAGAVAVIKSITPEIGSDEIFARLYESSVGIKGDKNSIAGIFQLEKAIQISARPSVKPIFKDFHTVSFKMDDGSFSFVLPVKNYWARAENLSVTISLNDSEIFLKKNKFEFERILESETIELKIDGTVSDMNFSKDSKKILTVSITVDGKTNSFKHDFYMARFLGLGDKVHDVPILYDGDMKDIAVIAKNGRLAGKIMTILDKYREYDFPEYYITKKIKDDMKVMIFEVDDGSVKVNRSVVIKNVSRLLDIQKIDLNYDGKPDYFIRSLGKKNEFILYSYLDYNLAPLFKVSNFKFVPETVFLKVSKANFIPYNDKINGKMAIPLFIQNGSIPESDLNPSVWEDDNLKKMSHLYYLEPESKNEKFVTRMVDNYKFMKRLEREFDVKDFQILGFVSQSRDDFTNGISTCQISFGEDYVRRKYYSIIVSNDAEYTFERIDFNGMNIDNDFRVPITLLKNNGVSEYYGSSAYIRFQTNTLTEYLVLRPEDQQNVLISSFYEHPRKKDHLIAPMAGFLKDGYSYMYFQSKGQIILKVDGDGESDIFKYPIHRVSLIPDNVFNEMFYPVTKGRGVDALPAFYVDATSLHSVHIYIMTSSRSGMKSPMESNIFIPDNCRAMTPVRFGGPESFAVLCQKSKDQFVFKYLPF